MRITVTGRYDRHRRTFEFNAHCVDCAADVAINLAKSYGELGSGAYGPMVWRHGEISIRAIDWEPRVIRQRRPIFTLLNLPFKSHNVHS